MKKLILTIATLISLLSVSCKHNEDPIPTTNSTTNGSTSNIITQYNDSTYLVGQSILVSNANSSKNYVQFMVDSVKTLSDSKTGWIYSSVGLPNSISFNLHGLSQADFNAHPLTIKIDNVLTNVTYKNYKIQRLYGTPYYYVSMQFLFTSPDANYYTFNVSYVIKS